MGNMPCEFCKQAEQDIEKYKTGYGKRYPQDVLDEIANLRQELCEKKKQCDAPCCKAGELIELLDNDNDIKKRKDFLLH